MGLKTGRGVELLQGEYFTIEPSSAKSGVASNVACTNVFTAYGERARYVFFLNVTAGGAVAGDKLDVFVDALAPDGATYLNAIHFTQIAGDAPVSSQFGVLDASAPGTATIATTSDCAAGVTRPALFGAAFRGRYTHTIVGALTFTWSLTCYAIGSRV